MTKYIRHALGFLVFAMSCIAMISAQASATWTPRYVGTSVNGHTVPTGYYEYLPTSYNSGTPLAKYSLLIFVHGSGEWGNGAATNPSDTSHTLANVTNAGVPAFIKNNTFPLAQTGGLFDTNNVIVLCPQNGNSSPMGDSVFRTFINFALAAYPKIDTRRIWYTGLSYGSTATTSAIDNTIDSFPDQPAAVVGCAWRGDDYNTPAIAAIGKIVPVWVLTSQEDISSNPDSCVDNLSSAIWGATIADTVFPTGTFTQPYTAYFNGLKWVLSDPATLPVDPINGVNPKITYFTGQDHNSWDRTYGNTNVWNWMFQQQKPDVSISTPTGTQTVQGAPITFNGTAADQYGTPITDRNMLWISNVDGLLGSGSSFTTASLSVGAHVIKLQATDTAYHDNIATINVTVTSNAGLPNSAPAITNGPATSTATVGSIYRFTYTASGFPSPTFTVIGSLPPGLTLNSTTGFITGIPTTVGTYSATLKATNSVSSVTQNFTINTQAGSNAAPVFVIGPSSATVITGTSYNFAFAATGSPLPTYTIAAGSSLPAGLSLNSTTGVVSGSPTAVGPFLAIITASNGVGTPATQNFSITAQSPASGLIVKAIDCGSASAYTASDGTVYQADTYYVGGANYFDGGAPNNFPSPDLPLYRYYHYSNATYTIPVPNGSYILHLKYCEMNSGQPVGGRVFSVAVQGTVVDPTFDIRAHVPSLTPLDMPYNVTVTNGVGNGNGTITVTFANESPAVGNAEYAAIVVEKAQLAPAITGGSPPTTGTVGTAYNFTYAVTGTPAPTFTVSAGSLPPGLSLNTTTGAITGTPTLAGNYNGTVTVSNGVGTNATQNFSIKVTGTFAQWATYYGAGAATATPQNDGVSNLIKYVCDINPSGPMDDIGRSALPLVGTNGNYLTLTYRQNSTINGATINVQSSTDLINWSNVPVQALYTDSFTGDTFMQGQADATGASKMFIRLHVSTP